MRYACCDPRRLAALRLHGTLNGIEALDVLDADAPAEADRQRLLRVHLAKPLDAALTPSNVRIEGGERVTEIDAVEVTAPAGAREALVRLGRYGDASPYTLRLVADAASDAPPPGFDPVLAAIAFGFKVDCPNPFDCAPDVACPPAPAEPGPDQYLAKDYAGFRRLMLDRLAERSPAWADVDPAGLGATLVELLAYTADRLSYAQDAVATEAYLGTARKRVSVRRHARLVDYAMHDGANARAWVCLTASADVVRTLPDAAVPAGTVLLTRVDGLAPGRLAPGSPDLARALAQAPEVFETTEPLVSVYAAHDEIRFHTWGDRACCLPAGATAATLAGALPGLRRGDVLVFAEKRGPDTGAEADADPARRHAVRLTAVEASEDPLGAWFGPDADALAPGATPPPVPVTNVAWGPADALPFPLCVSATVGTAFFDDVSVARGNAVLADHGRTVSEALDAVPFATVRRAAAPEAGCGQAAGALVLARYAPALAYGPLTQAGPPLRTDAPASDAFSRPAAGIVPALALRDGDGRVWTARRDLLASGPLAPDVVAEVDEDERTTLRFGDDRNGRRPDGGTAFVARYRVGNGPAGNVGAGAIAHVVVAEEAVTGVTNPLPATGGRAPETAAEVRTAAPFAFRTQERAVTADDYARAAERHPDVQRAAATFRWTGSWYTVFVTADRRGGRPVDAAFEADLRAHLERFRMAGHDLEVDAPRFVALDVALDVCVREGAARSDVRRALLDALTSGLRADGTPGPFHPDRLTFGGPVYLSPILAAAHAVAGVSSVSVRRFGRLGVADGAPLASGRLALGRLEVARLDHRADAPERGVLDLNLTGGQ